MKRPNFSRWLVVLTLGWVWTASAQDTTLVRHTHVFNPKNLGILDGPGRDQWQKPKEVIQRLSIQPGMAVADIGAGSGYFTLYFAEAVGKQGIVYAGDIAEEALELIAKRAKQRGLKNIKLIHSEETDTKLAPGSIDVAFLCDVYHEVSHPIELLKNVRTALKQSGRLAIIDFKKEPTPHGPPLEHRIPEEQLVKEVQLAGFRVRERLSILPYQYFIIFERAE